MSVSKRKVHIELYNKKLYDILKTFAKKGFFDKYRPTQIFFSSLTRENLSYMLEQDPFNRSKVYIEIVDLFGTTQEYDGPEGIYDVIPCFFVFLSYLFQWEYESFLEIKSALLNEQTEIAECFDKVFWEEECFGDTESPWDGMIRRTEKFSYDRFSDMSEHIITTNKWGVDAKEGFRYLNNGVDDDEYDRDEGKKLMDAIKKRSKYHDYNWDEFYRQKKEEDELYLKEKKNLKNGLRR